jgi:tRNA modification GTPase
VVPNLRQKKALEKASLDIARASSSAKAGESEEFIIFHLQSALNGLGTITGDTHTDDLLDLIFDRFCIGK